MAKKRFTTDLTIKADTTYSCNINKSYKDVYSLKQEIDSSLAANDGFVNILTSAAAKAATTVQTAEAILIKNTSNLVAEILIGLTDWKDSSNTDITNAVDIGGGSTRIRTISMLLPAGEFMYLPNHRMLSYSGAGGAGAIESASYASNGTVAIEPKSINSGNEYRDSGADVDSATEDAITDDLTAITLYMEDGHSKILKDGDLVQIGSEIIEVQSVGLGSDLATSIATMKRGLLGSILAVHADDAAINFFFGNEYLAFDVGKCMSDKQGRFSQRGAFFSKARTADGYVDGLTPGSVAIGPFYTEGGYLDWGLNGITANTSTGLAASTAYSITLVVDEYNVGGIDSVSSETAIAFTTDASDTTFNGSSNAVLPKIQAAINTQTKTTSSGLLNKSVSISLHNGDVRVRSNSNHSDTRVGISVSASGTTPFDVGKFPSRVGGDQPDLLGSSHGGSATDIIVYGPASSLAQEEITDPVSGIAQLNEKAFILDDGQGNLRYLDSIVGKINYEKGHCSWTIASLPEAEFKVYGQSNSAHSGGISYTVNATNTIQNIKARSINPIKDASLQVMVLG